MKPWIAIAAVLLTGCQHDGSSDAQSNDNSADRSPTTSVHVNQVGYLPSAGKLAIVADTAATRGKLVDDNGNVMFEAELSPVESWSPAAQSVRRFDFTAWQTPGRYRVETDLGARSPAFDIADNVLQRIGTTALRSFYLIRSGTALGEQFAGPYARPAGHADTDVLVHESAAGPVRAAGEVISSPGGWYDAGDYNKYIVVQKSTAATLDFAAVTAFAVRVFADRDAEYAQTLLAASRNAWQWALANPQVKYLQPADIGTGTYASPQETLADEWAWARTELFLTTRDNAYLDGWSPDAETGGLPSWDYVTPLAWLSVLTADDVPEGLEDIAGSRILDAAGMLASAAASGYQVSMGAYNGSSADGQAGVDFTWGSNGVAAVHSIVLTQAYRLTDDPRYRMAAQGDLDYLLGRNPPGQSYVTGLGSKPPLHVRNRPSQADDVTDPIPGLLAGGPHTGHQDAGNCTTDYVVANAPARSYLDDFCSYATNENAINWNAALVAATFLLQHDFNRP